MKNLKSVLPYIFIVALLLVATPSKAQEEVTAEDYARAEKFLGANTNGLVLNTVSGIQWLDEDKLIYQRSVEDGSEFILVDAASKTKNPAFDHQRLAESLSELEGIQVQPHQLPFRTFDYEEGKSLSFNYRNNRVECDLSSYKCTSAEQENTVSWNENKSPDGTKAVYIKDYNLWMRDLETGDSTQLTTDGEKDFGYATNNAGWVYRDSPVVLWSPDSKRIATFQQDARGVGEMYLASTKVGHPELEQWKYPLPGDSLIFRIERVVINLKDTPEVVRLKMEPDMQRSTITDHITNWSGDLLDAEWSDDSERLFFASVTRDHSKATLREANPETGEVRTILEEQEETFFESGYDEISWRVMENSNEVLWYSQRSDWAHFYLYDLRTGRLKHQITEGDWRVLDLVKPDEENRKIYFTASAIEEGNPYYHYLYSVNMDGSDLTLLTPGKANHSVNLSDGDYFVDTYSTPDTPPVSVLRTLNGDKVMDLEKADITKLKETGWQPPIEFSVKARDGETDLWGLMYKPINFDESKSYPVLNYLYPGPQSGSVGSRSFRASRSDKQSVAELGFVVIEVDAMGTPGRSKSFHEFYYGNMGDNGIPDQIAAIKQLAEQHSWIDTSRVGIWGHSGGGFASTRAILAYPDFYDVAVSGAGNHDNRNYADPWGEKWQGLLVDYGDSTNYDNQANQLLAKNLKGKLLLGHGTLDNNVPPYNTLLVVNALIEANKDFDMILLPNRRHGFGSYFMRKRWDYFVRHLKNTEPPKEYEFGKNIR